MNEEQRRINDYLTTHANGYLNRKSSTDIREHCNLESGGVTNEHVRHLIRDMIFNHGCAIGSEMWRDGYWIIQTKEELDKVTNSLYQRAESIQNRAQALVENFTNRTNG